VNTRAVRRFAAVWRQRFPCWAGRLQTTQAEVPVALRSRSLGRGDGTTGHDVERMDRDPRRLRNAQIHPQVSGTSSNATIARARPCTRATCCSRSTRGR